MTGGEPCSQAGESPATLQAQADAILARALTVVCNGWTEPRHAPVILKHGDPERVSHGMCQACVKAMEEQR